MPRYVLFSPIGGTDPISVDWRTNTVNDASMLHIARKYHPEHIVLYLSAEMLPNEKADNRYTDCIERLSKKDGFPTKWECVERPDLWEVQRYDIYLKDFQELVDKLHQEFPKHTIILNCSSGTPGMKSAMYILGCILPYPVLPIQVSTPAKRENRNHEYDTNLFWDLNRDNHPETYQDRTSKLEYKNLRVQLAAQNIEAHLKAYDYEAAFQVAEGIREHLSDEAMELLDAARKRVLLNWKAIPKHIQKRFGLRPDTDTEDRIQLSEYLLWLQMKQRRGDLGDFARGLTPALFALLRVAVEENGDTPLSAYCTSGDRITRDSLLSDSCGQGFLSFFPRDFTKGHLQTSNYDKAIQQRFLDRPWATPLRKLREIESNMRNPVAHTITRVDEDGLKELQRGAGMNSSEIMKLIRKSVEGINSDEENACGKIIRIYWDSYDVMNKKILNSMRGSVPGN